jgi:hypothetical protein
VAFLGLFNKWWLHVIMGAILFGAVLFIYLKGRHDATIEAERQVLQQDIRGRNTAEEVRRRVDASDDAALDQWLREWTRPGP